jgi:hypothetical protein
MGISLWQLVGIGLVLWVGYDLVMGYTYSYRLVLRDQEPLHYWLTILLWAAIAGITLYWG